jgi:hypothetical protein
MEEEEVLEEDTFGDDDCVAVLLCGASALIAV